MEYIYCYRCLGGPERFKRFKRSRAGSQARLWACGRGDVSTPSFGSHLNPILTRGADYALPILVSTPSFESHRRACGRSRKSKGSVVLGVLGGLEGPKGSDSLDGPKGSDSLDGPKSP